MARPLQEPLLVASTATTTHGAHTSDVPAVLLMTCSELLLATVNAIVKFVSGWPSERLMLVRFSIDFMLCSIVCLVRGLSSPSVIDWATLVVRGIAYCSGVSFFWAALRSCLPIGDVVVLLLSASPLFLVVSARVVLGEAIPREWPVQMALLIVGALWCRIDQQAIGSCYRLPAIDSIVAGRGSCLLGYDELRLASR